MTPTERCELALGITRNAGALALDYFRSRDTLHVDRKGHQDFVTEADRNVETAIRQDLAKAFPDDSVVGEEHQALQGSSGFTWVIDPIDGTANFVNGIPAWCVIVAGVENGRTRIGLIHDPCHDETYVAIAGQGATLNERPLHMPPDLTIRDGTVGIGFSNRVGSEGVMRLMAGLLENGGVFLRNASGGLSLAYVAAGRLLGYSEEHMNAWDCLAGQLLIAEAGGLVEDQDVDAMIADGGRVVAGAPSVFGELQKISNAAFSA